MSIDVSEIYKGISLEVDEELGTLIKRHMHKNARYVMERAAKQFIRVLQDEIRSSGLGPTAISALLKIRYTVDGSTFEDASVDISFEDVRRPSLAPDRYDGVYYLPGLLNEGYDSANGRVRGYWHGVKIASPLSREGAHFLESAADRFLAEYGDEYGISDVEIEDPEIFD